MSILLSLSLTCYGGVNRIIGDIFSSNCAERVLFGDWPPKNGKKKKTRESILSALIGRKLSVWPTESTAASLGSEIFQ